MYVDAPVTAEGIRNKISLKDRNSTIGMLEEKATSSRRKKA
jgi:hypothetical protein